MLLDDFVTRSAEGFSFSKLQSCRFAKQIATDFNPIHDVDAKRFCVPGDLLFAYLLSHYGLSKELTCTFAGMVSADVLLHCEQHNDELKICDAHGKVYLSLQRQGETSHDLAVIEPLIRDYVKFSGQNFPHILQPLMQQHSVMIHPGRPLVIYESMALSFDTLPTAEVELSLAASSLQVEGKRGNVLLQFVLTQHGTQIGCGEKRMILSNLQAYDEAQMQLMIAEYDRRKNLSRSHG
ncbi:DUF3581 family protein [Arsukibacterium indicum]|uniref:DUF3581 domain-containing protein n=1 Tax=Arsukibacterium indicum TaxID=2848612 RepID=A0ABS6MQD5_9GAMM|nr:DUF3581 family protein [Arsukibacterium indicum]MBV2131003.1 DUF3581 domain-containing protein [Arsukibacterium indicum]